MHMPRWISLAGAAMLLTGCGGDSSSSDSEVTEVAYHPAAAGFGVPADPFELNAAVERGDQRAIREHAWDIWASITAPSGERFQDAELPIWETWYSADELYVRSGRGLHRRRRCNRLPTRLRVAGAARRGAGRRAAMTVAEAVSRRSIASPKRSSITCAPSDYDEAQTLTDLERCLHHDRRRRGADDSRRSATRRSHSSRSSG